MTTDSSDSSAAKARYVVPTTPTERFYCEMLADFMVLKQTSVDSHLFYNLGADSLVMAKFFTRVGNRKDLPPVSIAEVYQYPASQVQNDYLAEMAMVAVTPHSPTSTNLATTVTGGWSDE